MGKIVVSRGMEVGKRVVDEVDSMRMIEDMDWVM